MRCKCRDCNYPFFFLLCTVNVLNSLAICSLTSIFAYLCAFYFVLFFYLFT